MFGNNKKVGRSFFDKKGKLLVTSYFVTLQGEGPFRGEPAVFVRLAMCNLACSFCDTYFDKGDWYTFAELAERLDKAFEDFPTAEGVTQKDFVLVITGGEPTLQTELQGFLREERHKYRDTQIESNGIQVLYDIPGTTLVVSPKCAEKDGMPTQYLKPNPEMLKRANVLKFVMCADVNSPYSTIPQWAHDWRKETGKAIFISPMNIYRQEPQKSKEMRAENKEITIEERSTFDEVISFWEEGLLDMPANKINHEYAANYAIRNGCIFNVQIHLLASVA